ncbi:MAG: hypothetical protein JWN62_841 [Acidimicrobiales bacterium]|nr:hypothetical protein [Acidimicrobiales bacterium]
MPIAAMRVARPTTDLARIRAFYEDAVGLPVLWTFDDHDAFDGVIFAIHGEAAQLEIVHTPHATSPRPTAEDVLVLYLSSPAEVAELGRRLLANGATAVPHDDADLNPYWPNSGAITFVDPDGYRLVISPA